MTEKNRENEINEAMEYIIDISEKYFTKDRFEKISNMYNELMDNIIHSPASSRPHFHNAFDGGYILHVKNVIQNAIKLYNLYFDNDIMHKNMKTFTLEELIFAAQFHDLYKLGDKNGVYYEPTYEKWENKRGILYNKNKNLHYMDATDKSFFMLQKYDIKYNENEFYGIRLADGAYDEHNKEYLSSFDGFNHVPLISIAILIHHADILATFYEFHENK